MIVQPSESEVLVDRAGNRAEESRQQSIDCRALRGRGRSRASKPNLIVGIYYASLDDAINDRSIPSSEIAIEEIEKLVLDDPATKARAGLEAPLIGIDV